VSNCVAPTTCQAMPQTATPERDKPGHPIAAITATAIATATPRTAQPTAETISFVSIASSFHP